MSDAILAQRRLCLGSRGSSLALWQTNYVRELLAAAWPGLTLAVEVISTRGDRLLDTPLPLIGGKGVFTAELEAALRGGEIDLAVHSLKDLPVDSPAGLTIGAIPRRADPADVLISRDGYTLETLPAGATVGTSSLRRKAQLLYGRPDLQTVDIRGNVDTRVRKALDPGGPYNAIVLAHAGLARLDLLHLASQILPLEQMLPAPGQGALAVQCRDEASLLSMLAPLHDAETSVAVTAERAFLSGLGGGCTVPIAALARLVDGELHVRGRVTAVDGSIRVDVNIIGDPLAARESGLDLAQMALDQGAGVLLNYEL